MNFRLKAVNEALRELNIFQHLSHYDPVLAGTFPIDLDIETSDLDILCAVYDAENLLAN